MEVPNVEESLCCYEAFYDATSNNTLSLRTCPVCGREKQGREGEQTFLLSDPSVLEVLMKKGENRMRREDASVEEVILRNLVEVDEGSANCWMCFDCMKALERRTMPKLALANNLWIGDVPNELMALTISEQLLIARHYPRCYIFKLFPRDSDMHIPPDHLYMGMAGNASLFELNTQEVVEMLKGQRMPSPVGTLASIIAITFVGSKKLPKDWLKKTFRVRRQMVLDALVWLQKNNPIYGDIHIDGKRVEELPVDDVPEELLAVVRQEDDEELAQKERESYLAFEDDGYIGEMAGGTDNKDMLVGDEGKENVCEIHLKDFEY